MNLRSHRYFMEYKGTIDNELYTNTDKNAEEQLLKLISYSKQLKLNNESSEESYLKYKTKKSSNKSSVVTNAYIKTLKQDNTLPNNFCVFTDIDLSQKSLSILNNTSSAKSIASSKNIIKSRKGKNVTNKRDIKHKYYNKKNKEIHKTSFINKASDFCRQPIKPNSQLFKTSMERNEMLQLLLHKIVLARKKEKEEQSWNNYINELKCKHGYNDFRPRKTPELFTREGHNLDMNGDCNDSVNQCRKCHCEHCFNKLCVGHCNANYPEHYDYLKKNMSFYEPYDYVNKLQCYSSSDEERLIDQNRALASYFSKYHPTERNGTNRIVDQNNSLNNYSTICMPSIKTDKNKIDNYPSFTNDNLQTESDLKCQECYENFEVSTLKSISLQTEPEKLAIAINCKLEGTAELNEDRNVKAKINPIRNISNKLDMLITSFNIFLNESRKLFDSKNTMTNYHCDCKLKSTDNEKHCLLKLNKVKYTCAMAHQSESDLEFSEYPFKHQKSIDTILYEENYKNNKIKRDIEEILTNNCSQLLDPEEMPDHIPSREHSYKPLHSVKESNQEVHQEKKIENMTTMDESKSMTIAINTDPLGLLALIRISADTVKQILSYMQNIDYYSYLSRLQVGGTPRSNIVARYMCNICGAYFSLPSQLSNHIQEHNLHNSRHCSVCQNAIKTKYHKELFACQYCGQIFTRAYCRELHEQSCARSVGKKHDITPSLMILN